MSLQRAGHSSNREGDGRAEMSNGPESETHSLNSKKICLEKRVSVAINELYHTEPIPVRIYLIKTNSGIY